MAGKQKNTGKTIYNLLVHELTVINKSLPESRKLSYKERLKLVSNRAYPHYKGTPRYKIRLTELRGYLTRLLKRNAKKREGCDLLAFPPVQYQEIQYFALDEFLATTLPECIYVKASADIFGETKIFNTRDYDYYKSGVKQITDNINKFVDENDLSSEAVPYYEGTIQQRPKKPNNGISDNYYLDLILVIRGVKAKSVSAVEIPQPKNQKQKKKRKKSQTQIRKRLAAMKMDKAKTKTFRRSVLGKIKDTKKILSDKSLTKLLGKKGLNEYLKKKYQDEIKRLKKNLKEGVLNKQQYETLLSKIKRAYDQ